MKKLFKFLGILLIIVIVLAGAGYLYLTLAFPKVSAATDLKIEATPQRLERGKYLAEGFFGCIDCHSDRNWSVFSGPVVPGTHGRGGQDLGEGAGFVPASNITPDKETGLGNWTDGEIFRAITSGVDKEGNFLGPMMPYTEFAKIDKEDIYSIIAYIKTLPAIKNAVPDKKLKFPLMLVFRTIPADANSFTKFPDQSDRVKVGEYYGKSCKFCHSPGEKGEFEPDKLFSGGVEFPMPDGKIVRSSNITPDKETGIGNYTKDIFIQKFKIHADPINLDPKVRDFNTPMMWNQFALICKDEDLGAIFDYLMVQKPVNNKVLKIGSQGLK
jgi:mono/diheme cytochrome c family protein